MEFTFEELNQKDTESLKMIQILLKNHLETNYSILTSDLVSEEQKQKVIEDNQITKESYDMACVILTDRLIDKLNRYIVAIADGLMK